MKKKSTKYANYSKKVLELINKIREKPLSYAFIILDYKYIIIIQEDDETKQKKIYKNKAKVS